MPSFPCPLLVMCLWASPCPLGSHFWTYSVIGRHFCALGHWCCEEKLRCRWVLTLQVGVTGMEHFLGC